MADMKSYENKYRGYLEDDADTFLKPEGSDTAKFIMGATASVGLLAGGYAAFKSGKLKPLMHSTILRAGKFRRGKAHALNDAVRTWSQDDGLGGLGDAASSIARREGGEAAENLMDFYRAAKRGREVLRDGMIEHERRVKELSKKQLIDKELNLKQRFAWKENVQEQLKKDAKSDRELTDAMKLIDDSIYQAGTLDPKEQQLMLNQTGFRHSTIKDLVDLGEINQKEEWIQEGIKLFENRATKKAEKEGKRLSDEAIKEAGEQFLQKQADPNILIDEKKNIADLRDFRNTFKGIVHSLTTDFTIPIVKINPLRMFYMDHFFSDINKPLVHLSTSSTKNPAITGHNGAQQSPHLFVDAKVYNLRKENKDGTSVTEQVKGNFFMADAQKGPVARLLRNMSGISISKFDTPEANASWVTRARYNLQSALDVGFQDEPASQFDFFDPTSWISGIANKVTGKIRMDDYVHRDDYLSNAFGKNKDFIYMRQAKGLDEAGSYKKWIGQLGAGRDSMEDVTLATLFPYGFFERLNSTLNQLNLGLSNKAQGSASELFGNLLLKRIAPVWAGIEMWDYLNYESENLLGFQIEDRFAQMYANSSVEMAKVRDNLGVTDWAKGVAPLLVGGEQIADIPFLGSLVDLDQTAEETLEYWEEGETEVRKGRWWPLGNTPFTGGKIDYYQPNWVRRTLADTKFSDVQYGSREEYFENTWMPTPRHPFAPIRHFVTDPYHYEEKHYQDRPYMVTGGITEIEEFPLIGPALNATIGQLLKPQKMMHQEHWTQPEIAPMTEEMTPLNVVPRASVSSSGDVNVAGSVIGSGSTGGISQDKMNQVLASYVTSSGQVQVYSTDDEQHIWNDQSILSEKSPIGTGHYRVMRPRQNSVVEGDMPVVPDTTASMSQMLGNLHYNASEMGGFYGFVGTSVTGEIADSRPVLQSSSDMTSYARAFWDEHIGGLGGDANEIFRRFVPADRGLNEINSIPNTMPDWLPGSNYFVDFQTGDPYTKVKKGEMRLPGEAFERLNNIDTEKMMKLKLGASSIGYDEAWIRDKILQEDAYKDEALMNILETGTKWHEDWEREMSRRNIAVAKEDGSGHYTEQYVADENMNIGGFYDVLAHHDKWLDWARENMVEFTYYRASDGSGDEQFEGFYEEGVKITDMSEEDQEAFYEQLVAASPQVLVDPKTRSSKRWDQDEMHFENVQQVNFYAHQTGTPINYLIHTDRTNPDRGIKVFAFESNTALLEHSYDKVEGVRQEIREDIDTGKLHRGNLYDIIDRYRILGDVAPYSEEFREMKKQISNMGLSEEEMEEVKIINQQVSAKNKRHRFYDYRFKTAQVEDQIVTVDHVIDNNTFVSKENPDNPIRLAGVRVSTAADNPVAQRAEQELRRTIREGSKVRIAVDADEQNRVKDDTYKTIQAVVYDSKGRNVNKYLIEQELGTEKENDYSAPAVHARFSEKEIRFGSMWESFAHMDTMIHTKMLQVRSPLESYERREVYGKDWQEWTDPVDDFLLPAIQNSAMHHPVVAIAGGAFIGAAFGSLKPSDVGGEKVVGRYGKIVGGFIGVSVMGAAVLNRMVHEAVTGEQWIPERRQKERDTEEYFDVLEYIKYNKLYNQYATLAEEKEGFNVKGYLASKKYSGDERKRRVKDLENLKRQLYTARPNAIKKILGELDALGIVAKTKDEAMKKINAEIQALKEHRELEKITPIASKALLYHQASKQTMYGYESGDPITNMLAALPKKDRDYLVPFINAPEQEREGILNVVPNYMKRVLQSAWGMKTDDKVALQEHFKDKPLPGANWKGWREDVSIEDVKVKFVDQMGLDPSEFDIWETDKERAAKLNVRAPDAFEGGGEDAISYSRKLKEILTGFNVQGLQVDVVQSNKKGLNVEMDIDHDRRDDVQALINKEGYHVL